MTREKKQDFILRISQSNRSQLVVIIYEIILTYLEEAKVAYEKKDMEEFRESIRKAQPFVSELMEALDFKYAISIELLQLYLYVNKALVRSILRREKRNLESAIVVLETLKVGFIGVSEQDDSAPLIQNAQQIYAGLTYSKGSLTETLKDENLSRGFLV